MAASDTPETSWAARLAEIYLTVKDTLYHPSKWLDGMAAASGAAGDVVAGAVGQVAETAGKVVSSAGRGLASGLGFSGLAVILVACGAAWAFYEYQQRAV